MIPGIFYVSRDIYYLKSQIIFLVLLVFLSLDKQKRIDLVLALPTKRKT